MRARNQAVLEKVVAIIHSRIGYLLLTDQTHSLL